MPRNRAGTTTGRSLLPPRRAARGRARPCPHLPPPKPPGLKSKHVGGARQSALFPQEAGSTLIRSLRGRVSTTRLPFPASHFLAGEHLVQLGRLGQHVHEGSADKQAACRRAAHRWWGRRRGCADGDMVSTVNVAVMACVNAPEKQSPTHRIASFFWRIIGKNLQRGEVAYWFRVGSPHPRRVLQFTRR